MQIFESQVQNYNLSIAEYTFWNETEVGVFRVEVFEDYLSLSHINDNCLFGAIDNNGMNLTSGTQAVRVGDIQYEYVPQNTTVTIESQVPLIAVLKAMQRTDLTNLDMLPYSDIMEAVEFVKKNRAKYGFKENTPKKNKGAMLLRIKQHFFR